MIIFKLVYSVRYRPLTAKIDLDLLNTKGIKKVLNLLLAVYMSR